MGEGAKFEVLLVGLGPALLDLIQPLLSPLKTLHLTKGTEVESFIETYQLGAGTPVLISTSVDGMNHMEVGQVLSSFYQGLHLMFLTNDRALFDLESLKKNGFTETLLLPVDRAVLHEITEELKRKRAGGVSRKYKAVKLVDVEANKALPFEVKAFLPANNKYVTLTASGKLSEKKIEILKKKNANSIFIDVDQVERFYEYAAEQLVAMGSSSNDSVSQTEKSEKMQSSVRQLFRSILDSSQSSSTFDEGRDLAEQSKKVVENYLVQKMGVNLGEQFKRLVGEGKDSYSHAQIVSTLVCLLSMATGLGKPEDLAIAGLFHDIGIYGISDDVSVFDMEKLSEEDKKQYLQHPKLSLNLLKEKKITVTQKVSEIIEKHHERIDAKGFPSGLSAHRIPIEAHLLAYADAFEYLTRQRPGMPAVQPLDAHKVISAQLGLTPEVLIKIEKFLTESAKEAA